jgi:hypothetical protein
MTGRYFSGIATGGNTFAVPDALLRDGVEVRLDGDTRPETPDAAGARGANGMRATLVARFGMLPSSISMISAPDQSGTHRIHWM